MSEKGSRISDALMGHGFDIAHFFDSESARGIAPRKLIEGSTTGLLIGNTRALWPVFSEHLRRAQGSSEAPLDEYTEDCVSESLEAFRPTALEFAHRLGPEPLPIQRICHATGFARISPMGLNVHEHYGPWFALRAVAFFDFSIAASQAERESPCRSCARPCEALFRQAVEERHPGQPRRFLPARMACPIGREHQYADDQIAHHYDRNPLLRQF